MLIKQLYEIWLELLEYSRVVATFGVRDSWGLYSFMQKFRLVGGGDPNSIQRVRSKPTPLEMELRSATHQDESVLPKFVNRMSNG